jgi:hypothetical protein
MLLCAAVVVAAPFDLASDEFPIGMFSVDSPGAVDDVVKMGVGYIHTYACGASTDEAGMAHDRAYLDTAQEHGAKVMFNLHGDTWAKHPDGLNQMLKFVNAFKDHPALGFWFLHDEPDGTCPVEQVQPFYEAVKRATPNMPVALCNCWSENWHGYQSALDILMTDIYPVTGVPFPEAKLDHVTTFTEGAVRLGKPVMPINQCFDWKVLAGDAETYRGSPTNTLRYPNTAELRYWCYAGLCQGVRGMFWWSYTRSVGVGYVWINSTFKDALAEYREFTNLVAPAHKPTIISRARDDDWFLALYERPSGTHLVLVNAWPLARPAFRGLEGKLQDATLTPWGSTRQVPARVEGGNLIVERAEPWESFVWKVGARQ